MSVTLTSETLSKHFYLTLFPDSHHQVICFSVPIFSFDFFTSVRNIGSILFGIPYKIILWRLIKLMLEMLRSSVISPGLANKRSLFITALK